MDADNKSENGSNIGIDGKQSEQKLEEKQDNEQIIKVVEAKVNELTANMVEELRKNFEKKLQSLKIEMARENGILKKELQETRQKFNGQEAKLVESDEKLEQMAQQLKQTKIDLEGEIANLKSQILATLHGEYSEDQVLTALELCLERSCAVQNVLKKCRELYRDGNNLHRHAEALRLVLRALEMHLGNKDVQIVGTASMLFIIDKFEMDQDTKRRVIQAFIDGIENNMDSPIVVQNCCSGLWLCQFMPQDTLFPYGKVANLLTLVLEMHCNSAEFSNGIIKRNAILLLNLMVYKVEVKLKLEMGEAGAIETMLQEISLKLEANVCDIVMEVGWAFLCNITGETPKNCERFLRAKGLSLLNQCYAEFADQYPELVRTLMGMIMNIAQVCQLQDHFITSEFLEISCKLLENLNKGIQISYISAAALAFFVSNELIWIKSGVTLSRDCVNELIVQAIEKWGLQERLSLSFTSLKPVLRLLPLWHAIGSQYWAVWALANLITTVADDNEKQEYCRLITEEGGMELLEQLKIDSRSSDGIRRLADVVIKNVEDWKKSSRED